MRRIARLDRSIDLLRTRSASQSPTTYLCLSCRHRTYPFSTTTHRNASKEKVPYSMRLRQKIWGTSDPPGQEDPYGDMSVIDQTKAKAKREELAELKAQEQERESGRKEEPDMSTYEPKDNSEGMEEVGGFGGWWKQNWDPEHRFEAFVPKTVESEPGAITAALHRAMVEVFALREAGLPVEGISSDAPGHDQTMDVKFEMAPQGPVLAFPEDLTRDDVVQSLAAEVDETVEHMDPTESEEDVAADRSDVDSLEEQRDSFEETEVKANPTESEEDVAADRSTEDPLETIQAETITYEDLIASWGPEWLEVPLSDPAVKFAVLKRMVQLTGIRIPDAGLKSSQTTQALLKHLIITPKPRKLHDALTQKEDLMTLPNVSVYKKRITPIDKEKRLGRWKLIEKELEERGLPVYGHKVG